MDKTKILEAMYDTLHDSMDWSEMEDYKPIYAHYVSGVIDLTTNLLKKYDEVKNVSHTLESEY